MQAQKPCELEQNDLLCGYCAPSRLYHFILALFEETCPEHHLGRTQGVRAPMRSTKLLKEKYGKQFPHWGVISQCYCQHREML